MHTVTMARLESIRRLVRDGMLGDALAEIAAERRLMAGGWRPESPMPRAAAKERLNYYQNLAGGLS